MITPTYDESGEAVHPDVYDAGAHWNGHRYWMVMTPFPAEDARKENPSILVSDNKTIWTVPNGLTNPIVLPDIGNLSDPDIVMVDGITMYVIFRNNALVKETHSTDGIIWSNPTTIIVAATETDIVSPAIVLDGSQYLMFSINADEHPYTVELHTCPTLTGTWSAPTVTDISIPSDEPWHIDVIRDGGILHAFIATLSRYGRYATSVDGLMWTLNDTPALMLGTASNWDQLIYRGSLVKTGTGFDLWYSAWKNVIPTVWHIGYTVMNP